MRAAILGTQHPDIHETEREILLAAGSEGLRQIAGYIPAKMPTDKPVFPPLAEKFVVLSDIILKVSCGETAHNNNPRVPYLALIWLLLSTNNVYCLKQYVTDDSQLRQVSGILMRIAVGSELYPATYTRRIIVEVISNWNSSVAKNLHTARVYDVLRSLMQAIFIMELNNNYSRATEWIYRALEMTVVMTYDTRLALLKCVEKWRYLPDEDLLQVMSQLMLDILPSENSSI